MNLRKRVEQLEGERGGGDEWFEVEHGDGRVEVITGPRGLILSISPTRKPGAYRNASGIAPCSGSRTAAGWSSWP